MLPFDEALKIVLNSARRLGTECVDLAEAAGRILAEDVTSDTDMPPFDKSLRDGYACRRADLRNELAIIETIAAGQTPQKTIGKNQCTKIMTGAMFPKGADCVVMVEFTESASRGTVRFTGSDTADNISRRGEDLKAGDIVLRKGEMIGPAHVGTLASVGCANPLVSLRLRVGVIITGNELVSAGEKPRGSQIRDSNGPQLAAQLAQVGAIVRSYGVVGDIEEDISAGVVRAAAENDVVLICGGVSVGDYDYVPAVLRRSGFELLFEKIAVKPGKPTVFGVRDGTFCFGLPGNPVSVLVTFELLVKPFLYKMMGHDHRPRIFRGSLGQAFRRKETDRLEWIPALTGDDGIVKLVEYHGSAHISALCKAEGLIAVDVGVSEISKGTTVNLRLL